MVVVRATPSVAQEQSFTMRQPMRLRVVAPQILLIIKRPFFDGREVQAIIAGRHKCSSVVSQSEIICLLKSRQGWLVKTTSRGRGQFIPVRDIFEFQSVVGTV